MQLLFPILLVVLMYVLLVRPQQQRARRQRELVSSLSVGAEVQTVGGLMGRIVGLDDELVRVEAAPGIVLTFVRGAIARVVEVQDAGAADEEEESDPTLHGDGSGPDHPADGSGPSDTVDLRDEGEVG